MHAKPSNMNDKKQAPFPLEITGKALVFMERALHCIDYERKKALSQMFLSATTPCCYWGFRTVNCDLLNYFAELSVQDFYYITKLFGGVEVCPDFAFVGAYCFAILQALDALFFKESNGVYHRINFVF